MAGVGLNIVQFIEHADLINDQSLSVAQKTCLKSIYGDPLEPDELEIYRRGTGRQAYDAREQQEATIIAGRRGGKTTKIAARIVVYEALRDQGCQAESWAVEGFCMPMMKSFAPVSSPADEVRARKVFAITASAT